MVYLFQLQPVYPNLASIVIVRIPSNRPEVSSDGPPSVDWNAEKENYLWDVIARSRAMDSGIPDWKSLATRLNVPLPYLLYRAQTRYEQDLRGLQDITGALSPSATHVSPKSGDDILSPVDKPSNVRRESGRIPNISKLSSSVRLTTPLGVRARLNSLTSNSPARANKTSSSSILTLQGHRRDFSALRPTSPLSSGSDSDEAAEKAEEAERQLGEQEELDKKLKALEQMISDESLGLVSSPNLKRKDKESDRGRMGTPFLPKLDGLDRNQMGRSDRSQSISSASSAHGSISSMPSPPPEPHSSVNRHFSPSEKSTNSTSLSPTGKGPSHIRHTLLVNKQKTSEKGSNHGSSASSFSDLSDASLSASGSAMESAFMSNIRGGNSRLSHYGRSYLSGRSGPQ